MKTILICLLFLVSGPVGAAAGKAIFVYGDVTVTGDDGRSKKLRKNRNVNPGDLIVTGKRSMVQLRMIDKGFISIRASSEFKIESFKLGESKEEDSGFFSLLKGGFRAITGVIGKRLKSAYKVQTTTATIGIRGTDYTARLCNQDCSKNFGSAANRSASVADGLYVGVLDGGVQLTNSLGTLSLDELQYGYVKDSSSAPVALLSAPEFLFIKSRPPTSDGEESDNESTTEVKTKTVVQRQAVEPESGDAANDSGIQEDASVNKTELSQSEIEEGSSVDQSIVTSGGSELSITDATLGASRSTIVAVGDAGSGNAISAVSSNLVAEVTIANNAMTRFNNSFVGSGNGVHTIGNASTLDLGFDPNSGIAWGRWNAGSSNYVASSGSSSTVDLNNGSLHWIAGPDRIDVALPSSGTANYQLIGNTSPTDNLGNTGVLGNASLSADFTNMTTSTQINIGIDDQVWNGAGTGNIGTNGQFSGNLDVDGSDVSSGAFTGQGSADGFFTNNADAAGMGYALEATVDGILTNVTGAATFEKQ